jgi:hypothetical protein
MAKPIIGLIPPSGWHCVQSDVRITAFDYKSLLTAVEEYRAQNGVPVGDVEGDVNAYICGNWPNNCHGVDMVTVQSISPQTNQAKLLEDIQTWARNILAGNNPVQLVSDELAEARAKICRGCPKNVNWRGGCASCVVVTDRACASLRQARDTASSAVLGGCTSMRHDNRTAIFLDRDIFQKATDLPEFCWVNL